MDVSYDHDFWGYKDYGANGVVKFAANRGFEYYLGTDYQAYSGSDAVLVITQKSEDVIAFFGQIATTSDLLQGATLAAGLRYNDPSVGESATVWNVSGRFDLPAQMYVRTLVGTSFRLPTAEELFADDPEDERGNPNLKPETGRNFSVSLGGAVLDQHLKWEVSAFYRDIEDLISFDGFDDDTDQSVAINVPGTVKVRGLEFTLDSALTNDLSVTASYTYNHAREEGDQQIARVPVQQAKATLDFHPAVHPFGASVSLNYVGDVYRSVWDGFEQYGNYWSWIWPAASIWIMRGTTA
ncbi:MAG: TonB-dependent receptor [Steroidobacteraceae bacterium]